jgi:hypothetical protein
VLVAERDYERAIELLREARGEAVALARPRGAVGRLIERLLGGKPPPRDDATDAFGRDRR